MERQPGLDKVLLADATGVPQGTIANPLVTTSSGGGATTVNQGTAGSIGQAWYVRPTADGTTTSLPLPANAAQETGGHLASVDAKLPTIGPQLSASSLSITFASNIPTLAVSIPGNSFDRNITGTVTGTGNVALSTQGCGVCAIQLSGSWSGTVNFQSSVDGTTWVAFLVEPAGGGTSVTTVSANGSWTGACAGYQQVRCLGATVTSTATVYLNASTASTTVTVESCALPQGAATAAKQPALGTAGTPSTDVLSVQGIVNGTPLPPERSTSGAPTGVTVSTSAALILASNTSAKSRVITNNGTSNVFLGTANTVTTTVATMGIWLKPGGTYSDSGDGFYNGAIYGIADAVSASQNVSAWERS